jgi:hypothetical protein
MEACSAGAITLIFGFPYFPSLLFAFLLPCALVLRGLISRLPNLFGIKDFRCCCIYSCILTNTINFHDLMAQGSCRMQYEKVHKHKARVANFKFSSTEIVFW